MYMPELQSTLRRMQRQRCKLILRRLLQRCRPSIQVSQVVGLFCTHPWSLQTVIGGTPTTPQMAEAACLEEEHSTPAFSRKAFTFLALPTLLISLILPIKCRSRFTRVMKVAFSFAQLTPPRSSTSFASDVTGSIVSTSPKMRNTINQSLMTAVPESTRA